MDRASGAGGQIVVTGASRGIGRAIAADLAGRDFAVAALSRSGHSDVGYGLVCDVTDERAVATALQQVAERGPIAGLVNNAGVHLASPSAQLCTEEYARVMNLNATAVMVAAREVYPYLKANQGGTIINIGSFFDKLGVAGNLAYCASKAAVGAISRCLAVEWAGDSIQVLNIAPGYIETDLNREFLARDSVAAWLQKRIPAGAPADPQQVARLIGAVLSAQVPFLTGETIYLDGGQGMNH